MKTARLKTLTSRGKKEDISDESLNLLLLDIANRKLEKAKTKEDVDRIVGQANQVLKSASKARKELLPK
jgi:hypothetical protein